MTIDGWYHVKQWRVSEWSSLDLLTLQARLRSEYIESRGFPHYNHASAVPYLLWAWTTSFPDRERSANILSTYTWVIKFELPMLKRYIDINVQPAFHFSIPKGCNFKLPHALRSSSREIRPHNESISWSNLEFHKIWRSEAITWKLCMAWCTVFPVLSSKACFIRRYKDIRTICTSSVYHLTSTLNAQLLGHGLAERLVPV